MGPDSGRSDPAGVFVEGSVRGGRPSATPDRNRKHDRRGRRRTAFFGATDCQAPVRRRANRALFAARRFASERTLTVNYRAGGNAALLTGGCPWLAEFDGRQRVGKTPALRVLLAVFMSACRLAGDCARRSNRWLPVFATANPNSQCIMIVPAPRGSVPFKSRCRAEKRWRNQHRHEIHRVLVAGLTCRSHPSRLVTWTCSYSFGIQRKSE